MIIVKQIIEKTYYIEEDIDIDSLAEDIENGNIDLEYICDFEDETCVDYKIEEDWERDIALFLHMRGLVFQHFANFVQNYYLTFSWKCVIIRA